jgi:hypothetical protein
VAAGCLWSIGIAACQAEPPQKDAGAPAAAPAQGMRVYLDDHGKPRLPSPEEIAAERAARAQLVPATPPVEVPAPGGGKMVNLEGREKPR